jgi:hypothetical protein
MFRIVITEILALSDGEPETTIERFEQTVDQIDLPKVFLAINTPPRKRRERKQQDAK